MKDATFETAREFLENVSNPVDFCKVLVQATIKDPTSSIMKINYQMFQIHSNNSLKDEYMSYFGLPIFTTLSDTKLNYEIEICQDPRLAEAVSNVSSQLNKDEHLSLQAQLFPNLISRIVFSDDAEFVETGVKIVIVLLLQPSTRRFVRPFVEDSLFLSIIKQKWVNNGFISDIEDAFYFPMDEINGFFYEKEEDYVAGHFLKIRTLQSKLLKNLDFAALSQMPLGSFVSIEQISPVIAQFSKQNLSAIIELMGVSGYPQDIHPSVLIDAIASSLVLRSIKVNKNVCAFPTEVPYIIY